MGSFAKVNATRGIVKIGENVTIGTGALIGSGAKGVFIGDHCLISPHAMILGQNYRFDTLEIPFYLQGTKNKGTTIGRNVWLGPGSCVLDGGEVGSNTIFTPNSVVSGKVRSGVIVQGNPAKVIFELR